MTDKPSETDGRAVRLTRRGVLAVAGAGAIAGCSSLNSLGGSDTPTIDSYDLPDIQRDDEREPPVPPTVPVEIAAEHFDTVRERVRSLLATLPTTLGADEIPNGHIRQRLTDAASDASDGLDSARTARTGLVALRSLRRARERARYAAAGWGVADRGLAAAKLRTEYARTVSAARSARQDHEYLGTDPVRAALVHARIEARLERAGKTEITPSEDSALLSVAEWGETAESAQAYLSDARHMQTQFTASLPADAGMVTPELTDAAETLLADVRDRQAKLPPEPTADDRTPERIVSADIRRDAESGVSRISDAIGPANAVIDAHNRLARFQALEHIQKRREAGELTRPVDAKSVCNIRRTAYDVLTGTLESSSHPELVRTVLVDASYQVMAADRELTHHRGEIPAAHLDSSIAGYWHATALARAAPVAADQTVSVLRYE
ncbi:hypothetical protein Harman_31240 [Haloarcula mannanilytica]|uniref:Uncharacterized protein n=1 Tax=Haloarcula mannanilytica TaxID=2509225 RepID=A0A4C2ESM7_9EURY|nr:hypothetical protein [Haloarcula mannanilytica]GCF15189.1 hypothetical protein Harman_31240 [Haloarcula mannanilytica]